MKGKRNAYRGGGGGEALSETESDAVLGGGSSSPKEQDRFLPIANVSRIMKRSLPANAKISKEAEETVQECVSEFISFVTGEASDNCQLEKRKTINGDDLLWAMSTLGFDSYVVPLKAYLNRYREAEGDRTIALAAHHRPCADQSMDQEATDSTVGGDGRRMGSSEKLKGRSFPPILRFPLRFNSALRSVPLNLDRRIGRRRFRHLVHWTSARGGWGGVGRRSAAAAGGRRGG